MTKHSDSTADLLAAGSAGSWIISLASYQPVVSFAAGIIAIVSGLLAARYYYYQTKKLKND